MAKTSDSLKVRIPGLVNLIPTKRVKRQRGLTRITRRQNVCGQTAYNKQAKAPQVTAKAP